MLQVIIGGCIFVAIVVLILVIAFVGAMGVNAATQAMLDRPTRRKM